jgi:uracil-DNA glycosylase family 4
MPYDIHPLNAPGMPPVGLDFIEESQLLGDNISKRQGEGKTAQQIVGPRLEQLIRSALYDGGRCSVNVTVKGAKKKPMPIISGHLWTNTDEPSAGPAKADVMIIGKQLGEVELASKQCFAGPAGILLEQTLNHFGVEPHEFNKIYVTPILKTGNPEGGDSWREVWVKNFIHLLHQELRIVRPKYILCLGADAVKALFGKNMTLGKMEGQVVEYKYDCRRKPTDEPDEHTALVMACTNPAAVLRSPDMTDKFELAISRFVQLIDGNRWDQAETDLDHRCLYTEDELEEAVNDALKMGEGNVIAMDCEWHGEHPQNANAYLRTIQFSWAHKTAAAIILRNAGGSPAFSVYARERTPEGKVVKTNRLTNDPELARKVVIRLMKKLLAKNRACGHFFTADLEWLIPFGLDIRDRFAAPATWMEAKEKGGLDTALMAHAVDETGDFTLTGQALRYTSAPRYDTGVIAWKEKYCRDNKMKVGQLEGYGECPDDVLYPYAIYDADVTRRIAMEHMKNLTRDRFGNNCWEAFWVSQRAVLAVLEIKLVGIPLDHKRIDELTSIYMAVKDELFEKIKAWANWPEINLNSPNHIREFLYGEKYNGKRTLDGSIVRLRPEGARTLNIIPLLTTEKRPRQWSTLTEEEQAENTASTNKAVLGMMYHMADKLRAEENGEIVEKDYKEVISLIRDYRYISQILKSVLRPPKVDGDNAFIVDEDDNWEYDGGLPGAQCDDGRVRTTIYQTKETGRWSSARPALQNISKRREVDFKRILGEKYRYPLRSVLTCPPGYVMVEADYIGAELYGMAIMSGDPTMIDHATRNQLPEDHPDFYDIHSNIAVLAFRFDCPPTKAGLAAIGMVHMRIIAKAVIFGVAYGRQAKAIALAAKEEGIEVTEQEAQAIINTIFKMYPGLTQFFNDCRARAVSRGNRDAPHWLCGPFGRFRRFNHTTDRQVQGDLERQAQNFPIQGMIADAVSVAIANLYDYRENAYANGWTVDDLDYQICLQVHDAIICFVRYDHVAYFIDTVLPACMIRGTPIYPSYLDGTPTDEGPYHLGIDTEVYTHWGVVMKPDEMQDLGIDPKYCHWKPGKGKVNGKDVEGLMQKEAYPGKIWYNGDLVALDKKK